jgi:ketosteroid isomerase-like protein
LDGWTISSRRSRGTFGILERTGEAMNMRVVCRTGGVGAALLLACSAPKVVSGNPQAEIAAMLERSAADWNHGDLAGFMSDYAKDSLTSYVSLGHVQYGWQPLYDHYRTAYFAPGKSRDSLAFSEVRVRSLTLDLTLCTARFELRRGDSVTASGPFTLLLQKRGNRWQILHDHTSSDPK